MKDNDPTPSEWLVYHQQQFKSSERRLASARQRLADFPRSSEAAKAVREAERQLEKKSEFLVAAENVYNEDLRLRAERERHQALRRERLRMYTSAGLSETTANELMSDPELPFKIAAHSPRKVWRKVRQVA